MKKFRKFSGMRPITFALDGVTKPFFRRRGFAENKILTEWNFIAGAELGKYSTPRKLNFKKDKKSDGILHVEVYDSGMATELTYMEPMLIEKISQYFGYRAVAKLKIIQRPGGLPVGNTSSYKNEKTVTLNNEKSVALNDMIKNIEDEELQKILKSLGGRILSE